MKAKEVIWSLSFFVLVSCFFERALYSCWLEWLMTQEMYFLRSLSGLLSWCVVA